MPSSSSSSSSGGLQPFYLFDGNGAVYVYDPDTQTTDLAFRIWGPGRGVVTGLASWGDNGMASVFCALKRNDDGTCWLLYRDGRGSPIIDLHVTTPHGWCELCPWPGSYTTMLAHTRDGISLIDTSGSTVTSTEISSGRRIYSMNTMSGDGFSTRVCCFSEFKSAGRKITGLWVDLNSLRAYGETVLVNNPGIGLGGLVQTKETLASINSDDGGVKVVTFAPSFESPRIPVGARGCSYPVPGGGALPTGYHDNVSVSTIVYSPDGTEKESGSPVFMASTTPGATSPATVIRMMVKGVLSVSNIRLGLVGMDGEGNVLVEPRGVFDAVTVPSGYFAGVNTSGDPDSPLNIPVPSLPDGPTGRMTSSEYVVIAMSPAADVTGISQCRFKWFFDYVVDPAYDPGRSSSSSSASSSSSS